MSGKNKTKKSKVYIVGAGPGDPFLITLRGFETLCKAEVILYDRLVNPLLLQYAKPNAEKIFVGKEPGKQKFSQDVINELLLKYASEGKNVVRLKGGDPYIFGRGSEEALFLKENGIDFEVIPGVTSALGASAYAGIPLTHRALITGVLFLTAHEDPTKSESQIDFKSIAQLKNITIAIYMGAGRLRSVVESLIANGFDKDAESAIVVEATTPRQRSFAATLCELPDLAEKTNLHPPLLTIISPSSRFQNQLNWFERNPLFGKKIITTRALDQSDSLFEKLIFEGAEVVPFQTFSTEQVSLSKSDFLELANKHFDWFVFTSQNGVRYFFSQLFENDFDSRFFGNSKIAVIGEKTAQEVRKYGLIPDFVPSKFNSNALIEEFTQKYNISQLNIIRIKGNFVKDPIGEFLASKAHRYENLIVYRINKINPSEDEKSKIINADADAIIFTASSIVDNFFEIFGETIARKMLEKIKVFAIGPMTAESLESKGIMNIYVAGKHTIEGIIDLMKQVFSKKEDL